MGNPPTFVINIYDEGQGQVCTCCRVCEGWRYVPGAQIFARCTVGSGGNAFLAIKTGLQPRKAKRGKRLRYRATLRNTDKDNGFGNIAFSLALPGDVTYQKSRSSINYVYLDGEGKKARYKKAKLYPVANATGSETTLTWSGLTFPPRRSININVQVRVKSDAQLGGSLTFSGWAYQQLPVNGLPYCESAYMNQTVSVIV